MIGDIQRDLLCYLKNIMFDYENAIISKVKVKSKMIRNQQTY